MIAQSTDNIIANFRFWLDAKGLSVHTVTNYTTMAGQFLKWCEEHGVMGHDVGRNEITRYLGELSGRVAPTTTYLNLLTIRYFYDYLTAEGEVVTNPARLVQRRVPRPRQVEPFTRDELQGMLRTCRSFREQAVFLLFVDCGLRRREVFNIKREDVNFNDQTVAVIGKGSKPRYVAMGPHTTESLRQALRFDERLVPFHSVEWVWWLVKDLAKRAGVRGRVHPHRFRHTFATSFLDAGGSLEELQIVLGHANLSQSLFYPKAGRERRALVRMREIDLTSHLFGADSDGEIA